AQGLATRARTLSEAGHDTLQQVPKDRQGDAVWLALLDVYLHITQSANSLLPAYASTHGAGPDELHRADASMAAARSSLPSMAFPLPSARGGRAATRAPNPGRAGLPHRRPGPAGTGTQRTYRLTTTAAEPPVQARRPCAGHRRGGSSAASGPGPRRSDR